ncbi:hypothetical protein QR680_017670 [Steinernema hermaphroditum]|uniref:C2H2-type domain-containing protein n=1 Tax=Steinernema hermaphroditum TaxID=289476 RepID=A0AA39LP28_9BILA|nr:hypothetical protein QR680_017670 [Steinernema hermaphroditum]
MASKDDDAAAVAGDESSESTPNEAQADVQIVEEDTVGQIIQGDDGEYYVVVEDASDSELEKLNNLELVVGEDGSKTLVVNDGSENVKYQLAPMKSEDGLSPKEERSSEEREDNSSTEPPTLEREERSHNVHSNKSQPRTVYAQNENGGLELVQVFEDDEDDGMNVGAGGDVSDLGAEYHTSVEPLPQGMKMRRNRVYGACRCPECGQSFVNTARLERHLAVHQVFGSFLCPLCGKTYKYEYNLFYHWRRNCRDLNELMPLDERKTMDVNALRELVDEVAQKKAEIGPIDIGISRNVLFSGGSQLKMDLPLSTGSGPKRGSTCKICGVYVLSAHFPRHAAAHRGEAVVDERSPCGGYFCDLCGLLFRHHFNLFKHWRTSCQEIQANLPDDIELTMDDDAIRRMVTDLVKRVAVNAMENEEEVSVNSISKQEDPISIEHVLRKSEVRSQVSHYSSVTEDLFDEAAEDQVVYADDYMDDFEGVMSGTSDDNNVLTSLNGISASSAYQRSKWSVNGGPVQCPECFRSFANSGRLERHLAGFHSAYGSHHCILCGNRFKYDYNLLYHYRRSCPYTKAFIDRDVREQMDATGLRKLVRNLASRDIRLNPHTVPPARMHHKRETGDALIRKQMMKYPTPSQLPPAHLMAPRPGLSDGRQCPVCAIFFYGNGVLERHMKAAHAQDYDVWEREHSRPSNDVPTVEDDTQPMEEGEEPPPEFADTDEPPPTLTAEQPSEQPIDNPEHEEDRMDAEALGIPMQSRVRPSRKRPIHHIVDENGVSIAQVHDLNDVEAQVQQLIDSGQLQDGDQIILMQDNEMEEYEADAEEHYFNSEEHRARASGSYQGDSRNAVYVNSTGDLQQVDESGLEVAAILTGMKDDPSGHGQGQPQEVVYLAQEDGTIITDEFGNPVVESYPPAKKPHFNHMPGDKSRTTSESSVMGDELLLPLSRVKAIVNQQPDTVAINEKGLYAMTKATEMFIGQLVKDALSIAKDKSTLEYDDISAYVRENSKYSYLQQFLPERMTVKEVRKAIAEQAANREWANEDPLMHIYQSTTDDEVARLLGEAEGGKEEVEDGFEAMGEDAAEEIAEEEDPTESSENAQEL